MIKKHTFFKPKVIVIKGDNFIAKNLYINFKRYSSSKTYYINDVNKINTTDIIIDCSFNDKSQNDTLKYCVENNIEKILILNHWKKNINEYKNIKIIQAIVPDVYGKEHMSFNRPGPGNNFESIINYCTFISESIRRIHESKSGFIPNTYLSYGENKVKYLYIDNLYKPIEYMLNNINETIEYEIYDEEKSVYNIISIIKNIIDYKGEIIFDNVRTIYNKPIKKLPFSYKYKSLSFNIRNIYKHLIYNNERFIIY